MCRRPCAYCAVETGEEIPANLLITSIPRDKLQIIDRIVDGLATLSTDTLSAIEYIVDGYEKAPALVHVVPAPKPYLLISKGRRIDAS